MTPNFPTRPPLPPIITTTHEAIHCQRADCHQHAAMIPRELPPPANPETRSELR